MAILLYGAGLRLMECCRLRIKDIDFAHNEIVVRSGKEIKIATRCYQVAVRDSLAQHLRRVKLQHEGDLKVGLGRVSLPNALDRKYPNTGKEWGWHGFFRRRVITIGLQANGAGITYMSRSCNRF